MNKNITPLNDKGQRHGYWEYYWATGKIWFRCVYYNGKENGIDEIYLNSGKLRFKNYYL